jgi:pimeloyl-ACP methyl ester carboxylesterase
VYMTSYQELYPFTSHWIDLGGHRLHYLDEGPRNATPIVMCHGNPTWSFYYRTLIPELSQNYRVIVPDHMGCGYSDKPQNYNYTLEQHIQNLEKLIEYLGLENIHLALHDWGGGIGMGYATRHPTNVASSIIFNTAAFYLPAVPLVLKLARSPILGEVMLRGVNLFASMAVYFAIKQHHRMTRQVRAGYLAPYNSWENRIAIYRFVQDIPLAQTHPTRTTVDAIDSKLYSLRNLPMLIIWGAGDFIFTVKDFLAGWQQRFPEAEVHILENAGHYVVEDAHEIILPLMSQFLASATK